MRIGVRSQSGEPSILTYARQIGADGTSIYLPLAFPDYDDISDTYRTLVGHSGHLSATYMRQMSIKAAGLVAERGIRIVW